MSALHFHQKSKPYVIKKDTRRLKKVVRFIGLGIFLSGLFFGVYFFFPLISWAMYLEPTFASQNVAAPIPKTTIVTQEYIQGLWLNTARSIQNIYDGGSTQNWVPSTTYDEVQISSAISYFFISIPKINIENAVVSTVNTNLSANLVNFPGTAIPPAKGNAAVFGHSTLPHLFDPNNYRTIFANAHNLEVGDTILVNSNQITYTYKIANISIVEADDTSYLAQDTDDSYLTIITCTPPGTLWKRLIIKSRLEKI